MGGHLKKKATATSVDRLEPFRVTLRMRKDAGSYVALSTPIQDREAIG